MSILKDQLSIFNKTELAFIKKIPESDGVYSFLFKKEKHLKWKAGQHGLFTITHKKVKDSIRPFSVASSPTEDVVRITTAISDQPSEFKKQLLELEEGMSITMSGPVGSFYLKDDKPALLMAGGIGITPFRAMIKQLAADGNGDRTPVELLYSASHKPHLFKNELDEMVKGTSINIHYLDSRNDMYHKMNQFKASHKNDACYFVSGPKSMIASITDHLKKNDISKRNIKKDIFRGIS